MSLPTILWYGLFASKLFLEAFDMVDTCHMNTIEGGMGAHASIYHKICELTVQQCPVKCMCPNFRKTND